MKKRFCALLILLLVFGFCFGGSALAEQSDEGLDHITDAASLLSDEEYGKLEKLAAQYDDKGVLLYIVTMEDYTEYTTGDVIACAGELYEYFNLGSPSDHSGLLLLLSMKELDYALIVRGPYGNYCFGDANRSLAEEAFLNGCRDQNWAGGFEAFLDLAGDVLDTAASLGLTADTPGRSAPGLSHPENTYVFGVPSEEAEAETEEPAPQQESEENSFPYVLDKAGLLNERQLSTLESRASELGEAHGCRLYIVTVEDHSEFNPDVFEAAKGIFTHYDLGYGDGRDGVILLLSMKERDYALAGHGQKGETICGYESSWLIEDEFLDNFRQNDWYGGFSDYLEACDKQLTKLEKGDDITEGADIIVGPDGQDYHAYNYPGARRGMSTPVKLLIAIGAPCLIALGICSTFKAQMKTARERTTAEEYVVPGSATLRLREDRFLNRTETRVPIRTESSSSGRGGGGGSSFHSSGGFSGRSGKF